VHGILNRERIGRVRVFRIPLAMLKIGKCTQVEEIIRAKSRKSRWSSHFSLTSISEHRMSPAEPKMWWKASPNMPPHPAM
jgi:hypothetical protein